MEYTTLGRTGLRVSVAGLGCGGFSRLGLSTGKSEAEAIGLVRRALDLGITLIDTAARYGTEAVVGAAIRGVAREAVVIATKARVHLGTTLFTPEQVVAGLDESLRRLGTDHVDVFQLHGVPPHLYAYARDVILPALLREQARGKLRFVGITETAPYDHEHATPLQAVQDGTWDVVMVAFHMMHQSARVRLFPQVLKKRIGTLVMFAVRSIFARPHLLAGTMKQLADEGKVPRWLAETPDPLGFLVHAGGALSVTDAAYRYARHEPGVDVALFGTGDVSHLEANVASLLRSPLPDADRRQLRELFGHLLGVGLVRPDHAKG
jgi:aryl-alcohol dehydrogenase-like predicted oxidoreductase